MYSCATGLIVQSGAEGYSLPIVESQNFGLPVFARDIEVLRKSRGRTTTSVFLREKNQETLLTSLWIGNHSCLQERMEKAEKQDNMLEESNKRSSENHN